MIFNVLTSFIDILYECVTVTAKNCLNKRKPYHHASGLGTLKPISMLLIGLDEMNRVMDCLPVWHSIEITVTPQLAECGTGFSVGLLESRSYGQVSSDLFIKQISDSITPKQALPTTMSEGIEGQGLLLHSSCIYIYADARRKAD